MVVAIPYAGAAQPPQLVLVIQLVLVVPVQEIALAFPIPQLLPEKSSV